jgi:hypothetical protein
MELFRPNWARILASDVWTDEIVPWLAAVEEEYAIEACTALPDQPGAALKVAGLAAVRFIRTGPTIARDAEARKERGR